jgi:type III secretion system HrpB7-like protein
MADPRLKAFAMVTRRLKRLKSDMRETLAAQQKQRDLAIAEVERQTQEVARATDELRAHEARIDALLTGSRAVRIDDLMSWEDHRGQAVGRRATQLGALAQLRDALTQIDQKIARTRTEIMRNDARLDRCGARVAQLHAQAQTRADDIQDEEAEEGVVNRQIARRAQARRDTRDIAR